MEKRPATPSLDDRSEGGFSGKILSRLALMAGSALFGGIAVALWSRRSLQRIHESVDRGRPDPQDADPDSSDD
jgi:hypothetical protein